MQWEWRFQEEKKKQQLDRTRSEKRKIRGPRASG